MSSNSNVVQMVYQLCKETFSPGGPVLIPPQQAIHRLTSLLDTVKPIDLGLDETSILEIERYSLEMEQNISSSYSRTAKTRKLHRRAGSGDRRRPPVTYVHIHQCDEFSIGIFCLPTSAVIPLHDHSGMTVLSKLLYGSIHVKSYDWFDPISDIAMNSNQQFGRPVGGRLAEMKSDAVLRPPCETSVLYPTTGANIHSFTAVTPCAVLDVLTPPYKQDPAYYRHYPYSTQLLRKGRKNKRDADYEGFVWLEEVEKPDNFILRGPAYEGPIINVI